MKKTISILLIASTLSAPIFCEVTQTAQTMSPEVVAELNKPVVKVDEKLGVASWIWIGVLVLVGGYAGTVAYNTRKPI